MFCRGDEEQVCQISADRYLSSVPPVSRAGRRCGPCWSVGGRSMPLYASLIRLPLGRCGTAAMDGVHGVFLALTMMDGPRISIDGVAAEERRGRAVVKLALESGVRHLVYSSINGAGAHSQIPYYESKERIEEDIHALGVPATW